MRRSLLMVILILSNDESVKIHLFLLAVSFNQPRFCPNASWIPVAVTFVNSSSIGTQPYSIFINTHNTIFVNHRTDRRIIIWANLSSPKSLFVGSNDKMFVGNDRPNSQVDRWTFNDTKLPSSLFAFSGCWSLFVDINDNLSCSQSEY